MPTPQARGVPPQVGPHGHHACRLHRRHAPRMPPRALHLHLVRVQLLPRDVLHHRLPRHHALLPQAAEPQELHTPVARSRPRTAAQWRCRATRWVASSHRHHHQHCDISKDPHTPYEVLVVALRLAPTRGSSEAGAATANAQNSRRSRFIGSWKTYMWHVPAGGGALRDGRPALARVGFLRPHVLGVPHHVGGHLARTCGAPSVQHGRSVETTGGRDLAFGEGWHNNHHALSSPPGTGWVVAIDMTWMCICVLKFFGLADKVKLPKQAQMDRMRQAAREGRRRRRRGGRLRREGRGTEAKVRRRQSHTSGARA